MLLLESERNHQQEAGYNTREMAYSSAAPIPLHKEHGQPKGPPERNFQRTEQRPSKSQKKLPQLTTEGTRQGEGMQGLTPNLRV